MKRSQGKVSIVSTCYNKEKYISKMLESVITQEWDNIELILVNDGSTDGTRNIIKDYEPKFKNRGYDVTVVDQENAGCCAAVYAGLLRMTGDYFCLVDCDDWIEPKYISHLANWLDAHENCDVTACNYVIYKSGNISQAPNYPYLIDNDKLLEKWILRMTLLPVWIYMSRISYLKKCGLIDNWKTKRNKTYEPLIAVPIMSGGGRFEFFNEPLYVYNQDDNSGLFVSGIGNIEVITEYYNDYKLQLEYSIGKANISNEKKHYLSCLVEFVYWQAIIGQISFKANEMKEQILVLCDNLIGTINKSLNTDYFSARNANSDEWQCFYHYIVDLVLKVGKNSMRRFEILEKQVNKVIILAALGESACWYLPRLNKTRMQPTELWDNKGNNVIVAKTPDVLPELTSRDVVLCLSRKPDIMAHYRDLFKNSKANLFFADDVDKILTLLKFITKKGDTYDNSY